MITVGACEDLASIRDEWRELFSLAGAMPFLSFEWLSSWHEHLAPGRRPFVLCAREGGRLVGLLPLALEELRPGPVRRLSFLGERWGGADFLDVLALPGRGAEVAEATVRHLLERRGFDLADLDGLPAGSPTVPILERLARGGAVREPRHVCPYVPLDGTWSDVLGRSKRADNFKRRLRKLKELGFERRVVRDPEEARAAFDRFLALHERRWSEQGGSDAMGRPALRAFHRDVVVRLAREGRLRFEELWVEGACRATIYGIDAGDAYCFYQTGYDPDWARHSVGLVCLGLSIEDAIARGAKTYDFLRGTERYKFDWASGTRETVRVRLSNRSVGTALLWAREGAESAARAAAHALLPAAAVELLRRVRRARERRAGSAARGGR